MWILLKKYLAKFILYLLRKKSITWRPGKGQKDLYMDIEEKFCDDLLRYGTITRDETVTNEEGEEFRQYTICYNGYYWNITKYRGEWIYIHFVC